jgi:hypothetical protein
VVSIVKLVGLLLLPVIESDNLCGSFWKREELSVPEFSSLQEDSSIKWFW